MIEPIFSLALSVQSNRGAYALLIGSGVSRAAGIPTGWEIVLDLLRKLAHLRGQDCEPDPAAWYEAVYGEEPSYSKLLAGIANSPAERKQLLGSYFEPTEQEREQGLKVPSRAHKAIARLVAEGFFKVLVTTNFDRLLERALEEAGVVPTVISNADAVRGALPLAQISCAVLKVNGDYLDTRIKNSPIELEKYEKPLEKLLDRVFDEFGLVVCGWSGEWDTGLRAALERCKSQRFTTYWTVRGEPKGAAKDLIALRKAQSVVVQDADSFFDELYEKVRALEEISRPHPLSAQVAVASLKKYLADDHQTVRLHDLVIHEVERAYGQLSEAHFSMEQVPFSPDELRRRVKRYEALTEILQNLLAVGCYWGRPVHDRVWVKALERLIHFGPRNGLPEWLNLRFYPALLLLYASGIAAVAAERYNVLSSLLTKAQFRDESRNEALPLVLGLYPGKVMGQAAGNVLLEENRNTPVSDHLQETLREPLREILPRDSEYQRFFDRFEYLLALVHGDLYEKRSKRFWGPIGCFGWRQSVIAEVGEEADAASRDWGPLRAGLFDGSTERFQSMKAAMDKRLAGVGWW